MTATERLRDRAIAAGATLFGVTDLVRSNHIDRLRAWLSQDMHGSMGYLERTDAVERRADLGKTLEQVRTAVVIGVDYARPGEPNYDDDPSRSVIARYARGRDYHSVLPDLLAQIAEELERIEPGCAYRSYVDTGPVLERELAHGAGLGWFGRNTMLIHPRRGSYFVLGVLLTDRELPPLDTDDSADRCGSCTACLDACPTAALLGRDENGAPILDARRCISYLTIEAKGPIPDDFRASIGNRVFGCDICQEVCPWNGRLAAERAEEAFEPRPDLHGSALVAFADRLLDMSEKGYQRAYADSPIARPRRRGMLRNVCVAIGNWVSAEGASASERALPTLRRALDDPQPLVRAHAVWALGRCDPGVATGVLTARRSVEDDDYVLREIDTALATLR